MRQDATGVDVELASGSRERYDLLLVAEGRSSRTRRLAFAEETTLRDHGVSIAYGTIDRIPGDTGYWDFLTGRGARNATIRPDDEGTIRASLSFESEPSGFEQLPFDAQMTVFARASAARAGRSSGSSTASRRDRTSSTRSAWSR